MRKLLVAAAVSVASFAAHAESLWGKANIGASVSDVASLYPDGAVFTPTDKHKMSNGAILQYRIDSIDISGKPFQVSFYFLDDKLTNVTLAHTSTETIFACELLAGNLQEALRAKYGQDIKNTRDGGLGVSRNASWVSGRITIGMSMYAYSTPSCSIYIGYSTRLAQDAEKL